MAERRISLSYRIIRRLVKTFYPPIRVEGTENLPEGPALVIGNHAQMNGPIAAELYFPGDHWTWCAGEMMALRQVPKYAFDDFWSFKPLWTRPFYRVLSFLIAPLSVIIFNNANTIAVRHGPKLLSTFRETLSRLAGGARVIVFPERNEKRNHILYAFQEGFVDVGRFYHRRTGERLPFVPMYLAPKLRLMVLGEPVYYDPNADPEAERQRICDSLAEAITRMAEALPEHTVIPYRNIPRRLYPKNR